MSTKLFGTCCCGVGELNNISHSRNPAEILLRVSRDLRDGFQDPKEPVFQAHPRPFIMFTGVVGPVNNLSHARTSRHDDYGQTFANYIQAKGLGEITVTEPGQNWTGNYLKVWLWRVDYNKLIPYLDQLEEEDRKNKHPFGYGHGV